MANKYKDRVRIFQNGKEIIDSGECNVLGNQVNSGWISWESLNWWDGTVEKHHIVIGLAPLTSLLPPGIVVEVTKPNG